MIELGRIGGPGEPATVLVQRREAVSRSAAEEAAVGLLTGWGVGLAVAQQMVGMAGRTWCDDYPTQSAVRIFEE